MKIETEEKLREAMRWCDENDKSTIFMIQYMQDYAKVNYDCVMKFLEDDSKKTKMSCVCGWRGTLYELDIDDKAGTSHCPKCDREYTEMGVTEETEKGV